MLTVEMHRGNREAIREGSYGRFLYNFYRIYDPSTGRYLEADPVGQLGGLNVFTFVRSDPVNGSDPWGLWETGGGVSGTYSFFTAGISWNTQTCCDDRGRKHRRRIQTTCASFGFGFQIKGGSGPASGQFTYGGKIPKCKGEQVGDSYHEWTEPAFSSALYGGAAWSSDDPLATTLITGLGAAVEWFGSCTYQVMDDVITGNCCSGR